MEITYRLLEGKDSLLYRTIRLESLKKYPQFFGSNYEQQIQLPKLSFQTVLEENQAGKFIYGAFVQGEIVGLCGFFRNNHVKTLHRGEIIQMYVKPSHQGQQIGRNLLYKSVEEAFKIEGIEQVLLEVISSNKSALKIYENVGFAQYGFHEKAYKENGNYYDLTYMQIMKEKFAKDLSTRP